uniref:Ovule protein n=1 Tax=Heterorhabditis bacteriophora TaxID=37862 RepID=A0A1I7WLJ6_HETBA
MRQGIKKYSDQVLYIFSIYEHLYLCISLSKLIPIWRLLRQLMQRCKWANLAQFGSHLRSFTRMVANWMMLVFLMKAFYGYNYFEFIFLL